MHDANFLINNLHTLQTLFISILKIRSSVRLGHLPAQNVLSWSIWSKSMININIFFFLIFLVCSDIAITELRKWHNHVNQTEDLKTL